MNKKLQAKGTKFQSSRKYTSVAWSHRQMTHWFT